ncbi:response regulator, partial [Calditrichota bacterium]
TDIIYFLKGLFFAFESAAVYKNISLKFETDLTSLEVYIDHDKFEKIINNLLSNAFKFTPEGGMVEVVISKPTPPFGHPSQKGSSIKSPLSGGDLGVGKSIQINIINTGPGIPADQIDKIFDRFYQVNNSYAKDGEGTGIGLALTKELVELHHGEIWVSSETLNKSIIEKHPPVSPLNRGDSSTTKLTKGDLTTTFTILLPLGKEHLKENEIIEPTPQISPLTKGGLRGINTTAKSDQPISQKTSPACPPTGVISTLRSPMILIVEDNADLRKYIRSNIEETYQILEAENGVAGWEQAVKEIPDLIISDVMMPEMDGFELCTKLKTDQRTSHIPVILLTARAAKEDKIEGLETGADDFIPKPFDAEELQIRIKNLIDQRKKLREQFSKQTNIEFDQITHTSTDQKFITRLMNIISQHISDSDFDLESLSHEVGLSRMQLYRKIKGLFGLTLGDFVKTIRLKQSAEMLKKNAGNITEIAYQVGFESPAYFSTCFRKQFGSSPSEFVKNIQKN